jgi:hypothetical protein
LHALVTLVDLEYRFNGLSDQAAEVLAFPELVFTAAGDLELNMVRRQFVAMIPDVRAVKETWERFEGKMTVAKREAADLVELGAAIRQLKKSVHESIREVWGRCGEALGIDGLGQEDPRIAIS